MNPPGVTAKVARPEGQRSDAKARESIARASEKLSEPRRRWVQPSTTIRTTRGVDMGARSMDVSEL